MKKHILYAFLFCSLFSLAGCLQEKETSQFLEKSLTVQQAKELYEAAVTVSLTKAIFDGEQTNMFHRESYSPNWKVALPTRTGDVESIDIPVNDERHYYVTTQDGQGFYLTRCHHSITIVRSTETKATGVYHHFFIPFRDSRNKYRDTYDGELYRNFHNNGFRDDFTGLEIYSDIEGRIVKLLRYYRGKLYTVLYAGNGAKDKKRIHYNLCYYILKAYSIRSNIRTKDGGHFICPKCECDLYESESGYYYCTHCPWSELDFYNQEIDETIIYGEGGGSNNGGSGNNNNLDPNLPDPNTGIGGSSGSGNGNSGITPEDIPDFVELDSTALQKILPTLILIMEDCAGTALINAISDLDIRFHYVSDLWDLAHLKRTAHIRSINGQIVDTHYVYHINYNISTPTIPERALFEELYHCLQKRNDHFAAYYTLNVEIEAKYATFLYLDKHGKFDEIPGYNNEKQCLRDYQNNPSAQNYLELINYVRNLKSGNIKPYFDFPEDAAHRTMLDLSSVFDCYD